MIPTQPLCAGYAVLDFQAHGEYLRYAECARSHVGRHGWLKLAETALERALAWSDRANGAPL